MSNLIKYNPNIHHRRSIRLKGYDYSQAGLYFITICCQNRIWRFGDVVDGIMKLNEFGQIAHDEWINTTTIRPNVELGEFIIMPNHMHGIIRINCRGELHSPEMKCELHSPEMKCESNSPEMKCKLHSPEIKCESNSPEMKTDSHSSEMKTDSHSSEMKTDSHSPEIKTDSHSSDNGGVYKVDVCKTPLRSPSQAVGAIVRGYKSSVTKQLGSMGFVEKLWQRNYYEHIIRDELSLQRISEYIINNPAKWAEDKFHRK